MHFVQDLRFALRRWALRPGFAAAALVTLALGIGATTALFGVVRAVLLRPLPYVEPERVAVLWSEAFPDEETWLSWREIVEYRKASRSFAHLAAATDFAANLTGGSEPERVAAAAATADAFPALGVPPLLGRTFTAAEDAPGGEKVVLLGHGLWRRRFGADPAIVGATVHVDGEAHTVVGVMPPEFHLPLAFREELPPELWVPLALGPESMDWGDRWLTGFGRLRPEATPRQASRELALVARQWAAAGYVVDQGDRRLERSAVPVAELVTRRVRPALRLLMGTVACILLIACVNVTNLQLVAAEGRRRELGVLAALGAARRRLLAQLLTESLLLAAAGGALGVALAFAATRLLVAAAPAGIPRLDSAGLDPQTLLFAAAAVLSAGLLFGLVPALAVSRPDLAAVLGEGGRAATPGRRRQGVRRGLVVLETALSLALLIGAGLLLRSLWSLRQVDLGLDPARVLTAQLSLPETTYPDAERIAAFWERLVAAAEALPEVESAAAVRLLPLTGEIGDWSIMLEGRPYDPRENPNGDWQVATPGYFETMGIRLLRGRFLADGDRAGAPFAAVVNRTMAARYWPGESALGRRFRLGTAPERPWFTIVGVVEDVHHNGVVEGERAEMVLPLAQFQAVTGSLRRSMTLVAKSRAEPLALAAAVRGIVRRLDPQLPVARVRTMEEVVGTALAQPRFTALLLALFAALALALAAVGLYGVVAYGVEARTQEIGIRLTLGSTRAGILRLVLSEGLAMAAAGIGIGLALARLLTRFLAGQIHGVTADDPATFLAVPLLLAAVALAATWLPAHRAAALDPARTLRG